MLSMNVTAKSLADYLVELHESPLTEKVTQIEPNAFTNELDIEQSKTLFINITELKDNSGLTYIGGKISSADLAIYLQQMKSHLGDRFVKYRENQARRDHQTFHVTLINPFEYREINKKSIKLGKSLSVTLLGLGHVAKDKKGAYFVVVRSAQAKFYRQTLALPKKDFHVTLGFNPQDIFGVSKGVDTLLKHKGGKVVQKR